MLNIKAQVGHSFLVLGCILLLTGCLKKFDRLSFFPSEEISSENYKLISDEDKARLVDLPLPSSKQKSGGSSQIWIHKESKDPRKQIIKYVDSGDLNELVNFYRVEMDYLGWQEVSIFNNGNACLNFQKPGKICNIVITPTGKNNYLILIFIGPKKS